MRWSTKSQFHGIKIHISSNKKQKNINQWACYNRIWSWSPMQCKNKKQKNINQWACYNRIWSWSPMQCKNMAFACHKWKKKTRPASFFMDCVPQALFSTQHGRPRLNHGLCPSGFVFHTTWKTRIQSWTVSLRLCFPHNMEDQDSIMDCVPQALFSTQHGRPGLNHRLCPSGFVFHTTWKTRIQSWTVSLRLGFPHNMEDQD